MPLRNRKPTSASGAPIDPETLYEPVQAFALGHEVYNADSRLLGAHPAVQTSPSLFIEVEADTPTKRKLRYDAMYGGEPVQHEPWSQPKPIPPARRLIATQDFELSVPAARALIRVHAGDVIDAADGLYADMIKTSPGHFRRADAPPRA